MSTKAASSSSSSSSSSGGSAGSRSTRGVQLAAAAAPVAGAASTDQPQQPDSQQESFSAEKLQWALAVPPEQRSPSMQGLIDSCECTTEATRLLSAAPLAQLGGPTKLRALLLLLKAFWAFGGRPPPIEGLSLECIIHTGTVPEQAQRNMSELVTMEAAGAHPALQPLWSVAVQAAYGIRLSSMAIAVIGARIAAQEDATVQQRAHALLQTAAQVLAVTQHSVKQRRTVLQRQLAGIGGGLFTARVLERRLLEQLAVVNTWAATPEGPYRGGRVNEAAAAAARTAFNAASELAEGDIAATSDNWSGLANLLRRTGAVTEADAALRRCLATAQAAGDPLRQLIAGWALASIMAGKEGWRYSEVAPMVQDLRRCLRECKPWLPNALWLSYKEHTHFMKDILADVRRTFPTSYATRPLPPWTSKPEPNTYVPNRAADHIGKCSGCGAVFFELKACAGCRTTKYCSRACQTAHWKAGHKAECAQLAACREGGAGGASGSRSG